MRACAPPTWEGLWVRCRPRGQCSSTSNGSCYESQQPLSLSGVFGVAASIPTLPYRGETVEAADVLTYNAEGKLVAFEQLGDATVANRVFAVS